jgi:hypothetical protein
MATNQVIQFYLDDFDQQLFPMNLSKGIIESRSDLLDAHLGRIFHERSVDAAFLPQQRVFAPKQKHYHRRTFKLDFVAEYFLYKCVYENRRSFSHRERDGRESYGFKFENGKFSTLNASNIKFKQRREELSKQFRSCVSFDISSYFNSIYHHDLVSWMAEVQEVDGTAEKIGKFLREINLGTTIDCFPQGIMPAKIMGANFLKFLDQSIQLKSDKLIRFMDDCVLFSDNRQDLIQDFFVVQKLLGLRGLNLNSEKTKFIDLDDQDSFSEITFTATSGEPIDLPEPTPLSKEATGNIDNLGFERLRDKTPDSGFLDRPFSPGIAEEYIHFFTLSEPVKIKMLYYRLREKGEEEKISDIFLELVSSYDILMEYQLFWIAKIAEDLLHNSSNYSKLLNALYFHPNASEVSRAKVLEIPENRDGLGDFRREHLIRGQSSWLAWASAYGCRNEKRISRNHKLKYFGNSSNLNYLMAEFLMNI